MMQIFMPCNCCVHVAQLKYSYSLVQRLFVMVMERLQREKSGVVLNLSLLFAVYHLASFYFLGKK